MKFQEMNLSTPLLRAVDEMGFEEATPIQTQTIPLGLDGKDIFGQAQTGTGKTAAFGLPLLEKLSIDEKKIQAIIIEPTRELAVQTGEELYNLGKYKEAKIVTVYGGAAIGRQIQLLKRQPEVVVGTPGRILDLIHRKVLKLHDVETVVLDEADEMLNMGFIDDIEAILREIPEKRQTLLFSATVPQEIKRISTNFMQNPEHVKIAAKEMTADLIDQYFTKCKDYEKFDILTRFIDIHNPELAIVFARTKRRVDEVARGLIERGYSAEGIHGDLTQQKRLQVLREFKAGKLDILVATDVAARGLDIGGVSHVYNFDIPQDPGAERERLQQVLQNLRIQCVKGLFPGLDVRGQMGGRRDDRLAENRLIHGMLPEKVHTDCKIAFKLFLGALPPRKSFFQILRQKLKALLNTGQIERVLGLEIMIDNPL